MILTMKAGYICSNLARKSGKLVAAWTVGLGLALASPSLAQMETIPVQPGSLPAASGSASGSAPGSAPGSAASPPATAAQLITPELPSLPGFDRYVPQDTSINVLLRLEQRKVYVFAGQKLVASFPVAIGRPSFPTPTGEFEIFEMIPNPAWKNPWTGEVEAPGPDGSLGLRWIGFLEMSNGVIGFHGTPNVGSIGRAASHGCVRMRNEDVVKLYDLVQIGTPVRVEP